MNTQKLRDMNLHAVADELEGVVVDKLISASEMAELTGAKTATKQCQVLQRSGIRYTVRADGRPILTWEAYNRQLLSPINDATINSGPRIEAI